MTDERRQRDRARACHRRAAGPDHRQRHRPDYRRRRIRLPARAERLREIDPAQHHRRLSARERAGDRRRPPGHRAGARPRGGVSERRGAVPLADRARERRVRGAGARRAQGHADRDGDALSAAGRPRTRGQ